MKLQATVGSLKNVLAAEVRAGERAAMTTMRSETTTLKLELRKQLQTAFGAKGVGIGNAWRDRVYPQGRSSLRPGGLVWSKVPAIVDAFDKGALIRPKAGRKFLAIPTGFNAARGRRGRGEKGMRVTPKQMIASRQAFLRPFKSGRGFVWCLPVTQASGLRRGRSGRGTTQVIAGNIAQVATGNVRGRAAWQRGLLKQGMVPMFLLLPQVKLGKRIDIAAAARAASARLPRAFVAAWERLSGRTA